MRNMIFAAFMAAMMPTTAGAQAPTRSATIARDVDGYALGMTIADVRKRMPLTHVAGETFVGTDGGISYEFGFTPAGRVYRIATVQKLGSFVPDVKFTQTLAGKLTDKYGAGKATSFQTAPCHGRWSNR